MGQFANGYSNSKNQAVAITRPGSIARPLHSERAKSWQMSVALTFIFGAIVLGACVSFYRQTRAEMTTALMRKEQEAARVTELQIEIARTQDEINKLNTDPRVIESLARENLGFVLPGEVVIRTRNPQANSGTPTNR
ncbi:MAG: FtsB family cell division protein [Blastocatellia bacterium]